MENYALYICVDTFVIRYIPKYDRISVRTMGNGLMIDFVALLDLFNFGCPK